MSMLPVDGMSDWAHWTRPIDPAETAYIDAYWTSQTGLPPSSMPGLDRLFYEDLIINSEPPP